MPDLSKRPERYATTLLTLTSIVAIAYIGFGVRLTTVGAERSTQGVAAGDVDAASGAHVASRNCSEFPDQEAAQIFWNAHRRQYPGWDGNGNGVVCEQLKSMAQLAALRRPAPSATPAGAPGTSEAADAAPTGVSPMQPGTTVTKTVTVPGATITEPAAPLSEKPPAAASKPTAPSKALILATRQMFGMYAATNDGYTNVESSLARETQIHGYFQGWDTSFRAANVNSAWSNGQIPMLTWESRPLNVTTTDVDYSLTNIADGQFDSYLRSYADAIVANGLPLIIRFDQEMNGNWYRWAEPDASYNNPKGSYIAAWRRVHDVFDAEGAGKYVIWDWSPNRSDNIGKLPSIDNYYPGDAYVDMVGMTGYLRTGDKNATFDGAYSSTLNQLRALAPGKPILLSEVGATENGGYKTAFINSFFAGLPNNPDVIGFVWFDYDITAGGVTDDWRIDSTTASLNAFRAGLYASNYGLPMGKRPVWGPASTAGPSPSPVTPTPLSTPVPTPSPTP